MANPVTIEVFGSFLEEARGYIPVMRQCLDALLSDASDQAALQELHRLAHNVRGAGNVIGMPEVGQLAEGLEDLVAQIADGIIPLDAELIALIGEGLEQISAALEVAASPHAPADPASPDSTIDPGFAADLIDGFLQEADEHLHSVGPWLRELEQNPGRKPLLQDIRRSVHTIKGAAAMVGLPALSKLAHRMEDLLDHLYEETVEATAETQRILYSAYDLLVDLVAARGNAAQFQNALESTYAGYDVVLSCAAVEAPAQAQPLPANSPDPVEASADAARMVRVPLEQLDMLMRMAGELFVQQSFFERQLSMTKREVEELSLSQDRLRRINFTLDLDQTHWRHGTVHSAGNTSGPASDGREEFDALEFDRYTQLHLITRDLVETGSDLNTAGSQLRDLIGGFNGYLTQQERLTRDIRDKLMRMRMVPLSTLANRLERTVRVTAAKTGKLAEITMDGLSTELDKKVLDELSAPLEHLLRNAVDHGIENPASRIAAGKPEAGRIHLNAYYEGADVVVRLTDDGAGLNEDKLRREAVLQGFAGDPGDLDWSQLQTLVFQPGFSTAEQVSEISGRGVGLDVVKAGVDALKGTISMESTPGQGVTFTLRLPMTLAVNKVLLIEVHGQTMALPLQSVVQAARVLASQIHGEKETRTLTLGAEQYPVIDLAHTLGLRDTAPDPPGRIPAVVLRSGGRLCAVLVDRILEAREVAMQPLTSVLRRLQAVAGTTILGDGSVVIILNPAQIASTMATPVKMQHRAAPARKALNILIVDDSLSVRRVVANLIKNTGWNSVQAKDGVEALEILDQSGFHPDAILMDVEMPRMDGFELTERLRIRSEFRYIPIIMLTSRAGAKHRNRGFQAGVNEYLVKPYQDEFLLATVRRLVSHTGNTAVG
ncbi:MAG: Hpt domain-containing protein [Acidobacteriia bacterium]|nr:Hpt domain-containing protein [Terriglobia bacterium]